MRIRLTILGTFVFLAVCVAIVTLPAGGQCESGIKKEYLDTDAGDFVDGVTLEIHTSGVRVKAIPDGSVLPAKIDSIFGAWTDKDSENNTLVIDTVYKATSDGFVTVWLAHVNYGVFGYTDSSNPPTTQRCGNDAGYGSGRGLTMPVKKNDYFKITADGGTPSIYWLPIGNGECQDQTP